MKTDENCIFCKIVEGKIPAEKIYEDENFLAISDIKPVGEGHTLIISKKHFSTLIDLDEKVSGTYIEAIKKTAKTLMGRYNSTGFNVVLNNGESAGQMVNHIHFHLLPRKKGDNKRGIFLG